MGLPILNMDGYLLKRIKQNTADLTQETAARTAADTALQQSLDALQGGLIGQEVPTPENGYIKICPETNGDKFALWIAQIGGTDGRYDWNRKSSNDYYRYYGANVSREIATSDISVPLLFNEDFNGGKPYLASVFIQTTFSFTFDGGDSSMRTARLGFRPSPSGSGTLIGSYDRAIYAPEETNTMTVNYEYGGGMIEMIAFTRPIFVNKDGIFLRRQMFCDVEVVGNQTLTGIGMRAWNQASQDYEENKFQIGMVAKFSE